MNIEERIKELEEEISKLKAEQDKGFKRGDLVLVSNNEKVWNVAFYGEYRVNNSYPYVTLQIEMDVFTPKADFKYCKPYKSPALPTNFITIEI